MDKTLVILFNRSVCALIDALGMTAENMQRQSLGYSMAYDDNAFYNLRTEHKINPEDFNEALSQVRVKR